MQDDKKIAVSVIIPIYNVMKYLPHTMECLRRQTFDDFEVICVDDNSYDDSFLLLTNYQYTFDKLILHKNEKNLGAGECRNIGLSIAKGEYVIFLDADDHFQDNLLENLYRKGQKQKADVIVYYTGHFVDGSPKMYIPDRKGKNVIYVSTYPILSDAKTRPYIYELITNSPFDKMVKKDLLIDHQIRFPNYPYTEDMVYSYESILIASKVVFLDEVMYFHRRKREGSLSQQICEKKSYIIEVLDDILFFEKERGMLPIQENSFWKFALHRIYQALNTISKNNYDDLLFRAREFLMEHYIPFRKTITSKSHMILCDSIYDSIMKDDVSEEYTDILRKNQIIIWKNNTKKVLVLLNNIFANILYKRKKLTDYYINDELLGYRQLIIANVSMLLSKIKNYKA